jgi:homoserine dehydrogenase
MDERTKVAIVGLGNVGTGVAQLLLDHGDRTARHAGRTLWLEAVVVRDVNAPRQVDLPAGILTDDLTRITNDPEIRVVAELIGGVEPARTIVLALLESGKDIVTANKALLAEHGPELFDRARELGRSIAFEASVMGGVPIVANISQCLSANQVTSLQAIVNGTSNFVLSAMDDHGMTYDEAVKEAQGRGYAEDDPAMDVDGTDAVQKLAILAHLAFGARVHWRDIPRAGIDTLDGADLRYARELGYRIKLLAVARLIDGGLELHVSPTLVRVGGTLAEVRGAFNAIRVVADFVGPVFFHGQGAGRLPTASAVVADMIDTAVGRTRITFRTLELWSNRDSGIVIRDHAKVPARYYLRFTVEDHPNVLAQIAGALGRHHVSIASVIQHEPEDDGEGQTVPLVIMTHQTTEGATEAAVREIDSLPCVRARSVRMRVLND